MSCKFQVGDRVLYWPFTPGVCGSAGTIINAKSTYSILWDDEKRLISGYPGTYLVLVLTAIDKLENIL